MSWWASFIIWITVIQVWVDKFLPSREIERLNGLTLDLADQLREIRRILRYTPVPRSYKSDDGEGEAP